MWLAPHRLGRSAIRVSLTFVLAICGCGGSPGHASKGGCDPNYKGACLDPSAYDYDCAGGSGDGPKYTGPVQIVGDDHFDLDRDGDGYACEWS
jgi:hypothetical protein